MRPSMWLMSTALWSLAAVVWTVAGFPGLGLTYALFAGFGVWSYKRKRGEQ